jgi:hypothetical protein
VFNGQSQPGIVSPSDSSAAGGPTNVLEQVNGGVAVYSRSGSRVYGPVTLGSWYLRPNTDAMSDVHTIFDPNRKRFITMMMDLTINSWVVHVSDTSDALSASCIYTFSALNSGATSVDFPLVGVSPKYLMLTIRENGGGNRLVVLTLAQLEACGTADTLVRVLDYNPADTYGYLVNSYAGGGHDVSLYKFSDSSPPRALIGASVATPSYIPAQPAVQKGSSVVVDTGSAAITQAVNYTYGMYATLTNGFVNNGGVANILWMKLIPTRRQRSTTDNSTTARWPTSTHRSARNQTGRPCILMPCPGQLSIPARRWSA